MTLQEAIDRLKHLPPEKQQLVIKIIEETADEDKSSLRAVSTLLAELLDIARKDLSENKAAFLGIDE